MDKNQNDAPAVAMPVSGPPANTRLRESLRFLAGTLIVLALSMSLNAIMLYGPEFTGLEIWKKLTRVVSPTAVVFVVGLALALAWPRQWIAVGCAPMLLCVVILTSWGMRHPGDESNGTGILFVFFMVLTGASFVGAAVGVALRGFQKTRVGR